jgi:hypothetical protein
MTPIGMDPGTQPPCTQRLCAGPPRALRFGVLALQSLVDRSIGDVAEELAAGATDPSF